jgi:amidase
MKPPGYLSYVSDHIVTQWPPTQETYDYLSTGNPMIMNLIFSMDYLRETFRTGVEFKGHRKVFELRAAYDAVLSGVDVLITPTVPIVAFEFPPSTMGEYWGESEGGSGVELRHLSVQRHGASGHERALWVWG